MEPLEPAAREMHPDNPARIRDQFSRHGLMAHLGASIQDIQPGRVSIVLPFGAHVTQHHGYFHAGCTSAIADTAGGFAAATLYGPGRTVLTVEYKINLLAPGVGERLLAIGEVVRSGRTLTVTNLSVLALTGSDRKLIATGQQTLMAVAE